jgi:hypothetical protein
VSAFCTPRCAEIVPEHVWNSTNMPEWEYRKIDLKRYPVRRPISIDKSGDNGWELVIITINNVPQEADP